MDIRVDMKNLINAGQSESASDLQAEEIDNGEESRASEPSSADDHHEFMARALKKYSIRMNYKIGENTRDSQVGTNIQGYIESVHQTKVAREMRTTSILGQIDERQISSQVDDGAASS